ncbi:SepM family pheromone-processing serine protease [Marinilactibacillus sp. Marseille-P9653]|uniref:SepM family pheromone-processing serine protease n=1 Tax=Marinilactibacillus sp. Marseille-P9653 TaxID=2866583 RepID=UPI001CE49C55|nr:SepM family pheromone-processing serine protease [Marinilactibacillus sp. Marseille-P9653]
MKKIPLWIKLVVILGFGYLFFLRPIPYYIERPGGVLDLNPVVEVEGAYSEEPGKFMMTTVEILQATPFSYLFQFLPYNDVVTEAELFGEIDDYEAYNRLQKYYMDSSVHSAVVAAFDAAELPYDLTYNGVYVMSVTENSNFSSSLQMGDTITSVDELEFENTDQFMDYIKSKEVGNTVTIHYERDGVESVSEGQLIELEETGEPGIGISLVDQSTVVTDPEVTIHSGQIGGPSAGLMYSLQIYSMITDSDLRDGQTIAGTGTISDDGTVGPIGGIDKKVVAADKEGATVFFAPDDELSAELKEDYPDYKTNYEVAVEAAEDIDTDMVIVPVKTFSDAVDYLKSLSPVAQLPSDKDLVPLIAA